MQWPLASSTCEMTALTTSTRGGATIYNPTDRRMKMEGLKPAFVPELRKEDQLSRPGFLGRLSAAEFGTTAYAALKSR